MTQTRPRICLFEPRIPQNTGNIARTCAAFNIKLDLIDPLGFSLEDKYLKRAGLDYWKYVDVEVHSNFHVYQKTITEGQRVIGLSKTADQSITNFNFTNGDVLLFGREDNGLPNEIRNQCSNLIKIPMPGGTNQPGINSGVRSLNLSVACGITLFHAGVNSGCF